MIVLAAVALSLPFWFAARRRREQLAKQAASEFDAKYHPKNWKPIK